MSNTALLRNNNLSFRNAGADQAVLTATASTITFSGVGAANCILSGVANPVAAQDAATKDYVDAVAEGHYWKDAVQVATTGPGVLATSFAAGQVVDGYTLVAGDRILIKDQTVGTENGIYVVQAVGSPVRAEDMAVGSDASGASMFVESGTANSDSAWVCTNNKGSGIVGTDVLTFVIFSRSGGIAAGNNGEFQYNNNGSLAGITTLTTNGTNVALDGGNFSVGDSDSINIGDASDLSLSHNGTDSAITSTTGDLVVDNTNATGSTVMRLGTDTSAVDFQVQNDSGVAQFTVDGSGQTTAAGNFDANGGIDIPDNQNLTLGDGADLTMVHNGTNSTITSATGNLVVDNTSATGQTILQTGTDTSATSVQVQNDSGAALLQVSGDGSTDVNLSSGAAFTINDSGAAAEFTVAESGQVDVAGNMDVTGGVDIDADNAALTIGAGADFQIVHDGTDTTATSATGNFVMDNTNATGSTIARLGTNTDATSFQVQANDTSAALTVHADGTTTTAGDLTAQGRISGITTVTTINTAGLVTYSAAQMFNGIITRDPNGAARTDTTATAAQLVAEVNDAVVGSSFYFILDNSADADETITILPGVGVTIAGSTSVGQGAHRLYKVVLTNVSTLTEAATMYDLGDNLGGSATPGGADTTVQFNNGGTLDGIATLTTSGGNLAMDGGNMTFGDNDSLSFGDSSDLSIVHDATNSVVTSTTGEFRIDNTNATGASVMMLGTDTSATSFQVQNDSASALMTVNGAGQVDVPGNMDVSGGIDIDADGVFLTIGAGADFGIEHDGTNTIMVSNTGDLFVDNINTTGQTVMLLGTDTSATSFQVQNNSGTAALTVGGDRTSTFSGRVDIDDTTQSTSSTTGALVVDGGIGIAKDVFCAGSMTAIDFQATSDRNLKQDIEIIQSPLEKLDSINAFQYRFNFIEDDHLRYGVMAQELEEAGMGHMVVEGADGRKRVDYNNLVGLLIGSVKELKEEIANLKI